jgi:hypothetical protein
MVPSERYLEALIHANRTSLVFNNNNKILYVQIEEKNR